MHTNLNERVAIIDTRALGESNIVAAYLLTGKETALIDMGYHSSTQTVLNRLVELGIGPDGLDYLLPTHVHLDHSGSCGALARIFAQASVRVHPKGEPHLVDATALWKGAGELFGKELMQNYGKPEPVEQKRIRIIRDEEVIDLGEGIVLRAVWTPGHASHHLSYEWEGFSSFFTGDAVGIRYPAFPILVPTTPPTSFNFEQTLESLERIRACHPSEFYTPHFGVVEDANQWVGRNIESLVRWKSMIEGMMEKRFSEKEIWESLTLETCKEMGQPLSTMPAYLRISIKLSVLGFLRYLNKQAQSESTSQ